MIISNNISIQRGAQLLFTDATFTIAAKQKIAIIGKNGSGKSSLFALLLNELQPAAGTLNIKTKARMAHLSQELPALEIPAIEYVTQGDVEFCQIEQQLNQAIVCNEQLKISELHARFADIDGYTVKARAAELLYGLGFHAADYTKPVKDFSGGWRTRLNLAQTLMSRSDILLLDEPTNHLDLDAIIWLEKWLKKYTGTLLFISHDRDFIDAISDHIIHIENKKIKIYTGNYESFEKLRAMNLAHHEAAYKKQQLEIAHLEKFINRFRAKATKAKQAQSRIKALEKMELIAAAHVDNDFNFSFKASDSCPNPLLKLNKVNAGYADKIILENLKIELTPNLRLGLLGPNGAGKSTLIKLFAGILQPISGEIYKHQNVKIGYFAQHQIDHLQMHASPIQHLQTFDLKTPEQQLRDFLGGFAFTGEKALTPIQNFSGGEKARLALAILVWRRPNLLLLDEPTNHLDLDMRDALTLALQSFAGAMVIVSHDRHLLRATADEFYLVANKTATPFKGDIEDYQQWLEDEKKRENLSNSQQTETSHKQYYAQKKQLESQLKKLDKEISSIQKQLKIIEEKLLEIYNQFTSNEETNAKLQQYTAEQKQLTNKLHETEQLWLELSEQLTQIQ